MTTVVQPAYSPELNPAERVFEEVRRWVEGRVYGSIEEKVEAVNAYLRGEGGGGERLPEQTGIRPRTGQVAGGLGVDQTERSGADCRLRGLIKLKRY